MELVAKMIEERFAQIAFAVRDEPNPHVREFLFSALAYEFTRDVMAPINQEGAE